MTQDKMKAHTAKAFLVTCMDFRLFNDTARIMKQKGYDEAGIATKTGLNPYYLRKKYIPQAAKFQLAQLKASVQACIQADEDVKTGKLSDTLSVELIIISLSK